VSAFNDIIFKYSQHSQRARGPAISGLWCAIVEVKQRWSVIGWVTKNVLSRAPPCFGRHIGLAVFEVVSKPTRTGPAWWVMACSPYV
jgi:hypothetical protein